MRTDANLDFFVSAMLSLIRRTQKVIQLSCYKIAFKKPKCGPIVLVQSCNKKLKHSATDLLIEKTPKQPASSLLNQACHNQCHDSRLVVTLCNPGCVKRLCSFDCITYSMDSFHNGHQFINILFICISISLSRLMK